MATGFRMIYWSTAGCRRYIDLRHGDQLPAAPESKRGLLDLAGPLLFGIALLTGIAFWAVTGQGLVAAGVVVAALAFVFGGLIGRGVGRGAVRASGEVRKRRDG